MRGENRMFKFFLFPKKLKHERNPPPFIAFDCENNPKTGDFISVAWYGKYIDSNSNIQDTEGYSTSRFEFMDTLRKIASKRPGRNAFRLVGHNVDYDLNYITEIIQDGTRLSSGSRLITARLKCGGIKGIKIFDTMNFIRGSLKDWIEDLNMSKIGIVKLPLTQLKERNLMDAKATWYLMDFINNFIMNELQIPLQSTIGACSLYYFQTQHLSKGLIRNSEYLNEFERKAYKGGRCETFKRGNQHVKSYDVHKMYLSIMRDIEVPLPQSARFVKGDKGFNELLKSDKLFIAYVKVQVSKQYIAPLPYFKDKLIFPTGIFSGHYCSNELRESLKHGVKILKVYEYVYYREKIKLFEKFADRVWELFNRYEKMHNPNLAYMIKTIGNSLYGKFGEKHGGNQWIKLIDYDGDIEGCDGMFYQGEEYVYIRGGKSEDSKHTFPCIPAFITAAGRVLLLNRLKLREKEAVYCDTDSAHVDTILDLDNGDGLGEWGFEYEKEQEYHKPKMYGDKCKGVPGKAELVAVGNEYFYYSYQKPLKRAEAIRKGDRQNKWIWILKRVSLIDDKRSWDGFESNPLHLNDI